MTPSRQSIRSTRRHPVRKGTTVKREDADAIVEAIRVKTKLKLREREEHPWVALPHQIPPSDPDWDVWFLQAGRGTGKTDAGAHYINDRANENPGCRIAIVAPTQDDAKETCVEGLTGLLAANPSIKFHKPHTLIWPNGTRGRIFGAYTPEEVERFRGPQYHYVWCEEMAAWRYLDKAWEQIQMGLRLGPKPRAVVTTTPKPRKLIKTLLKHPQTRVTRAHTKDNPHLAPEVRQRLIDTYGETTLGRQELAAEIIEDVVGALWKRSTIEDGRLDKLDVPLARIVVCLDPAMTATERSDETGLIVVGKGLCGCRVRLEGDKPEMHGFVLADLSLVASPAGWAQAAIDAYIKWNADRIIGEVNNGGDMIEHTLHTIDPHIPFTAVRASRGKAVRAEPVAALYEEGKFHHVGGYPELEDELCSWTQEQLSESPDRLDALVWGGTELFIGDTGQPGMRWL